MITDETETDFINSFSYDFILHSACPVRWFPLVELNCDNSLFGVWRVYNNILTFIISISSVVVINVKRHDRFYVHKKFWDYVIIILTCMISLSCRVMTFSSLSLSSNIVSFSCINRASSFLFVSNRFLLSSDNKLVPSL